LPLLSDQALVYIYGSIAGSVGEEQAIRILQQGLASRL
jgi:hypothetical protein